MIQRHILHEENFAYDKFDYFNDYDDTRHWLETFLHCRSDVVKPILENLAVGFNTWHKDFIERNRPHYPKCPTCDDTGEVACCDPTPLEPTQPYPDCNYGQSNSQNRT